MNNYFLPPHVHLCRRGDDFVFLDLRQDEYTLVNGSAAEALRYASASDTEGRPEPSQLAAALRELVEGGLLTQNASAGKSISVTQTELAVEPLVDAEMLPQTSTRIHHIWYFISACLTAWVKLRLGKIEATVSGVERRKSRHASGAPIDLAKARELTAVFQKLRAFFPSDYLCLYDSLALIEFLARYRVFPSWVFGVKLEPWAAHCWVQADRRAFNEDVEVAAGYTPIMTV